MIIILPLVIVVGILIWVLRPGRAPARPRRIAILATTVPSIVVAVAAIVFQLLYNRGGTIEVASISNALFVVGLGLIGAYILGLIGFVVARRGEIARGAGFGTCISIVVSVIELGLLEWLGGV
jgi:hypothetical protein